MLCSDGAVLVCWAFATFAGIMHTPSQDLGQRTTDSEWSSRMASVVWFVGGVGEARPGAYHPAPVPALLMVSCSYPQQFIHTKPIRAGTNEGTLNSSCRSTRHAPPCLLALHQQASRSPIFVFPFAQHLLLMVSRAGPRVWWGFKIITMMAAVHLAFMALSQIKCTQSARTVGIVWGVGTGFT